MQKMTSHCTDGVTEAVEPGTSPGRWPEAAFLTLRVISLMPPDSEDPPAKSPKAMPTPSTGPMPQGVISRAATLLSHLRTDSTVLPTNGQKTARPRRTAMDTSLTATAETRAWPPPHRARTGRAPGCSSRRWESWTGASGWSSTTAAATAGHPRRPRAGRFSCCGTRPPWARAPTRSPARACLPQTRARAPARAAL